MSRSRYDSCTVEPTGIAVVCLAVGLLMTPQVPRQDASTRAPIDVSKLGPQVGERVPQFELKDQSGKSWTLRSIMGVKGAMLVFFRSADW